MAILDLENLTWEDVDRLDRSQTIIFLPISPLEEHGPQLPIGTDFFAARDMARLAVQILEGSNNLLSYVIHPGIPIGCASIIADFPGTLSVSSKAMMQIVNDSCVSLAQHEFKFVVISNHHYEPAHVKAILTAINKVTHRYEIKVADPVSDLAVVKINAAGLPAAKIGDSSQMQVEGGGK